MKTLCRGALLLSLFFGLNAFALLTSKTVSTEGPGAAQGVREHTAAAIVRLHQAGLDPRVLLAYIQSRRVPYNATAEDILFLHQNKIPEEVIVAWINTGSALISTAVQAQAQAHAPAPARSPDLVAAYGNNQAGPIVVQQQPVVYQAAPAVIAAPPVAYSYPTYVYPSYGWSVSPYFGFSYGWRRPYWSGWSHYRHPHHHFGSWHGGWAGHYRHPGHFGRHHTGHRHFGHYRGGGHFGAHRVGFAGHFGHRHGSHGGHFRGGHRR
jgi:hypothetical protein